MFSSGTMGYTIGRPELKRTLWRCERCDSLVTILCLDTIREALCPVCTEVEMEFCGSLDGVSERGFADA